MTTATTKKRRSRDEWAALIDEMSASGLPQSTWCKQHNINYRSMRSMKDALSKAASHDKRATTGVKPAKTVAPAGFVRLSLPKETTAPTSEPQSLKLQFGQLILTVEVVR
jgi:hypothetical protein